MATELSLTRLQDYLPEHVLIANAQGGIALDLSILAGQQITMETSTVLPLKKLLEAYSKLNEAINLARQSINPPPPTVDFVSESVSASGGIASVAYTAVFNLNSDLVDPAVVDPTAA